MLVPHAEMQTPLSCSFLQAEAGRGCGQLGLPTLDRASGLSPFSSLLPSFSQPYLSSSH